MSANAAHIEGTPSSIRMASKERIAMHPAPRIAICSGDESKRLLGKSQSFFGSFFFWYHKKQSYHCNRRHSL
jgi:hypothetical protein